MEEKGTRRYNGEETRMGVVEGKGTRRLRPHPVVFLIMTSCSQGLMEFIRLL